MARTKGQTDETRTKANNDRLARTSRRAEPPLVISETPIARPRRQTRQPKPVYDKKGKGKAPAVESDTSDESDSDAESEMRRAMEESRREQERRARAQPEPPRPAPRQPRMVPNRPREHPEETYDLVGSRLFQFRSMVAGGMSRMAAYMVIETEACREREALDRSRQLNEDYDYHRGLRLNGFDGTRYACVATLEQFGILEDFELLAQNCGLFQLLTTPYNTYVEECVDFLATVCTHIYDKRITGLQQRDGGGYLSFTVRGLHYRCTFRQIQELFGLHEGVVDSAAVDKNEVDAVWRLLTGHPTYASSNQKGSWIRNPAVSYFRTAVGNTMYARDTTGNVNRSEAEILVIALRERLGTVYGQELLGDTANASFAAILGNHLHCYRNRAYKQACSNKTRKTVCGGIVSAIMRMCGVELRDLDESGRQNVIEYRLMDIRFLQNLTMIPRKRGFSDFYRFIHPQRDRAYIRLPRPDLTSLRGYETMRNAEFIPPLDELDTLGERLPTPPPPVSPSDEEEPDLDIPLPQGRAAGGIKTRLGFIQRMQRGLLKGYKSLLKKMKAKDEKIDRLEQRVERLEARHSMSVDIGTSSRFEPHRLRRTHSYAGHTQTDAMDTSPAAAEDDDTEEEPSQLIRRRRRH